MAEPMRACEQAHPWIVVAIQGFVGEGQLRLNAASRRRVARSNSPEPSGLSSPPASPSSSNYAGTESSRSWNWSSRSRSRSSTRGERSGSEAPHETDTVEVTLVLISRRQWRRAGTRYHHRGIDDHGLFPILFIPHAPFCFFVQFESLMLSEKVMRARQAMSQIM